MPSSVAVNGSMPNPQPRTDPSPVSSYPTVVFLSDVTGEQTGTISENQSRFFASETLSTELIRQVVGANVTIQNINVVSPQKAIVTGVHTNVSGRTSIIDFEFYISGEDAHLIQIQKYGNTTLLFHMLSSPDYENPKDADGNNIYRVKATIKYGERTESAFFNLQIMDAADGTTFVTSDNGDNLRAPAYERLSNNIKIKISEGETLIFNFKNAPNAVNGVDSNDVEIVRRGEKNFELRFKQPPDRSNPADHDRNNIYEFQFNGGALSENLAFEVEVVSLEMV